MLIKLKANIPEIALGALLTISIFLMGTVFESSRHPFSDQETAAHTENQRAVVASQNSENKITDWLLVFFSGLLFAANVALWRVTKTSADAAKVSADAAKNSADAAISAERARFYVVIKKHNVSGLISKLSHYPNSPTMPLSFEPKIEYVFKNYGRTPGIILEVAHGLAANDGPPDVPFYMVSDRLVSENMIAANGETEIFTFDGPIMFQTQADGLPLIQGHKNFWFWGRFDYRDVFGRPQVHRFLMRYVRMGREWGWQPFDHKHYNQST